MPDGSDGDRPRGRAGDDGLELASEVLQWLHECGSSANPIANIAANHLLPDQSFFDRVAAEMSVSKVNFRLFRRNKLLQELSKDIRANGLTVVAGRLAEEFAVHASRHNVLDLAKNDYPPGSRQYKMHEVFRLNKGRRLRWRHIYDILQLRLS
jgi:hypothetical protein